MTTESPSWNAKAPPRTRESRKRSYGTQSERGNRFAERIMTVTHTARKQAKNVFEFLTACCRAWTNGTQAPLLLPARAMPP